MSVVYCDVNAEDFYNVYCLGCRKLISTNATMPELADYIKADIKLLCFDCEALGVDDLPRHLFCPLERYFIGMDDKIFLAEWLTDEAMPGNKDLRMYRISLTTYFDLKTGFGVKYSPLSSTLNLNRKFQKSGAFLEDRGLPTCSP